MIFIDYISITQSVVLKVLRLKNIVLYLKRDQRSDIRICIGIPSYMDEDV